MKITDYEIKRENLIKGEKLGRGGFADVFRLDISYFILEGKFISKNLKLLQARNSHSKITKEE